MLKVRSVSRKSKHNDKVRTNLQDAAAYRSSNSISISSSSSSDSQLRRQQRFLFGGSRTKSINISLTNRSCESSSSSMITVQGCRVGSIISRLFRKNKPCASNTRPTTIDNATNGETAGHVDNNDPKLFFVKPTPTKTTDRMYDVDNSSTSQTLTSSLQTSYASLLIRRKDLIWDDVSFEFSTRKLTSCLRIGKFSTSTVQQQQQHPAHSQVSFDKVIISEFSQQPDVSEHDDKNGVDNCVVGDDCTLLNNRHNSTINSIETKTTKYVVTICTVNEFEKSRELYIPCKSFLSRREQEQHLLAYFVCNSNGDKRRKNKDDSKSYKNRSLEKKYLYCTKSNDKSLPNDNNNFENSADIVQQLMGRKQHRNTILEKEPRRIKSESHLSSLSTMDLNEIIYREAVLDRRNSH